MWPINQQQLPDVKVCVLLAIGLCALGWLPPTEGLALKEIDEFAIGQTTTIASEELEATTASPVECGPANFLQGNFTLYDYSVVLGMLVISLGIGMFKQFVIPISLK